MFYFVAHDVKEGAKVNKKVSVVKPMTIVSIALMLINIDDFTKSFNILFSNSNESNQKALLKEGLFNIYYDNSAGSTTGLMLSTSHRSSVTNTSIFF